MRNSQLKIMLCTVSFGISLVASAQDEEASSMFQKRVLIFNHRAPAERPELIVYEKMPDAVTEAPMLISSLKPANNNLATPTDGQAASEQGPLNADLKVTKGTPDKATSPSIKPPLQNKSVAPKKPPTTTPEVLEDHGKDGSDPIFDQGQVEENDDNYMEESFSNQEQKSE